MHGATVKALTTVLKTLYHGSCEEWTAKPKLVESIMQPRLE
jgi:hypothetical protein